MFVLLMLLLVFLWFFSLPFISFNDFIRHPLIFIFYPGHYIRLCWTYQNKNNTLLFYAILSDTSFHLYVYQLMEIYFSFKLSDLHFDLVELYLSVLISHCHYILVSFYSTETFFRRFPLQAI